MMRLGLIVNPLAGLGGTVGLKGSDGLAAEALAKGAVPRAQERAALVLERLKPFSPQVTLKVWGGAMGEAVALATGWPCEVLGVPSDVDESAHASTQSSGGLLSTKPSDTIAAARCMARECDLVLFAGGDGTARDMVDAVGLSVPVLGIPAGVKIHSGVYAVNPQSAADIVIALLQGQAAALTDTEVRDIDENAFREGRVIARTWGELRVPGMPRYLQHVKCGGKEVEALVLAEIAADIIDRLDEDHYYVVGCGTTTLAILEALHQPGTLLGVDLLKGRTCIGNDLDEASLWQQLEGKPFTIIVTATGGQGHILGRGNQQISPRLIRAAGRERLWVIATPSKLDGLAGPLRVDTGDPALDAELSGWIRVTTGFDCFSMVPVGDFHSVSSIAP
jgi:predicted polyphosphate/ATP-dependent NAD kinase